MALSSNHSEQTKKILHAAGQLFARQGYHGTSTREIARVAEISENTLFRYFDHKEELFWAALRSRLKDLELRRDLLESIAESGSPEVVLPQILAQLVDTAILKPELLRLIAVAFIELHWKAESVCSEHLSPIFSAVNHYFERTIASGKLRNLDASVLTAALATTAMLHPEFCKLITGAPPAFSDSREAIRVYSRFWLAMLTPDQASSTISARSVEATFEQFQG